MPLDAMVSVCEAFGTFNLKSAVLGLSVRASYSNSLIHPIMTLTVPKACSNSSRGRAVAEWDVLVGTTQSTLESDKSPAEFSSKVYRHIPCNTTGPLLHISSDVRMGSIKSTLLGRY